MCVEFPMYGLCDVRLPHLCPHHAFDDTGAPRAGAPALILIAGGPCRRGQAQRWLPGKPLAMLRCLRNCFERLVLTRKSVVVGPDFEKHPLVPAIAQDAATGEVLMLAYMNAEAFAETLRTGRVCYFSRSRNKLWRKGEESGNVQEVHEVLYDCDADAVLVKVNQVGGAACHTGYKTCFFRKITAGGQEFEVVGTPVFDPAQVYKKN